MALYGSEDRFVASVQDFLRPAWHDDGAAVVLLTDAHRRRLAAALAEEGVDLAAAERQGRVTLLDAEETLAGFLLDGGVDLDVVRPALDALLQRVAGGRRGVRVCGEMVALLWERGDITGAIRLEELWDRYTSAYGLTVFCPFPLSAFGDPDDTGAFRTLCDHHTHVIPAEPYTEDHTEEQRLRRVAELQLAADAAVRDRDRLRAVHDEMAAALDHLREQDQLRTQFVAMVAHDLQSPMAVLRGLLGLLRENWGELDTTEAEEFLSRSLRSAGQLERLVRDVLTVARLEGGEFSFDLGPVELGSLIGDVASDLAAAGGRVIEVRIPEGLPPVWADADRQRQILANLLSNALKFSPDDSPVDVTVHDRADHLAIAVRDRGVGIAEAAIPVLFRPFIRGDAPRERADGTGLGLYITKALVEAQGGDIAVRSSPGEGATFTYTVPVRQHQLPTSSV